MSRTVVYSIAGVVALAAAAFLLLQSGIVSIGSSDISGVTPDGANAPTPLGGSADATTTKAGAGTSDTRPLLAAGGRHPERAGIGAATARVLLAVGEKPVAGAALIVRGTGYANEVVEVRGVTDATGAVKIPKVPAGAGYVVRVEVQGEPPVEVPDVEVKAGRVKDLGAILVGARTDIVGRVVDEKGVGLAGADVRALVTFSNPMEMLGNLVELFTTMGREPTPLARTTSGSDGAFRLAGLAPGTVAVRATAPGRKQALATVRLLAAEAAATPTTLVLAPGSNAAGVVVEASGSPVAGATVALMSEGSNDFTDILAGRVFATTDARGRFEAVVDPTAKSLRGIVEAEGYPTTVGPRFAAGATDVRIVLQRGAEVEATVLLEGTEEPVAGVTIAVMVGDTEGGMDGPEGSGAMISGATDAQGVARIPARPGHVEGVLVSDAAHGLSMLSPGGADGPSGGAATGTVPAVIVAGAPTRFTLHMRGGVTVAGVVKSSSGAPIEGAEVKSAMFFGGGGGPGVRTDASGAYKITMSGGGMFGAASSMIVVVKPGFVSASENLTIDDEARRSGSMTHDVTLRPGATVGGKVLDPEGKPVAGAKVSYSGGGLDFAAMMAAMTGGGGNVTDAGGAYVLRDVGAVGGDGTDSEPAGTGPESEIARALRRREREARVSVSAEGFVPTSSEGFAVKEGATVEAPTIRLSRGATLHGTVRDPGGRPASDATIEVHVQPKTPVDDVTSMVTVNGRGRTVRADAEGRFDVPAIPVGTVTLTASSAGAAATRKTLKIEAESDSPPVEIALRHASELKIVVLDADGRPVGKANVSIDGGLAGRDGDDGFVEPASTRTDADGHATLASLPPGSVTVSARATGFHSATSQTPTGGTVEIRLTARPAAETKRIAEIDTEIRDVSMKYATAKDDAERTAVQKRLAELQREKQKLKADDGPDGGVEVVMPDDSK